VLSLYLDLRPDQHGRDNYDTFLRKTLLERGRTLKGDARKSFERDAERIRGYLNTDVPQSTTGLAVFACAAADDFFEAVQLEAPIEVDSSTPQTDLDTERIKLAGELVTRAQQSAARIRFIEDPELLAEVGGVGALLRFKI
jgi:peptide subunit release factor 1 (eRF1)